MTLQNTKEMSSIALKYEMKALESRYYKNNWDLCTSARWKDLIGAYIGYDKHKRYLEDLNEHPMFRFESKDRYDKLYENIKEGD